MEPMWCQDWNRGRSEQEWDEVRRRWSQATHMDGCGKFRQHDAGAKTDASLSRVVARMVCQEGEEDMVTVDKGIACGLRRETALKKGEQDKTTGHEMGWDGMGWDRMRPRFHPHPPSLLHRGLAKALGAGMWFFIFYRAR
ncbi:hypothetical protein I316_00700 [Kwoniella heveanensis BCC8398]|uniref:Uncharacterized protein n=1 Tax=Kwoniella heveanensis BCC8398 TaxID=1296120 RepID=A0A1B9H2S2_9TREE|nr:hypothetical protein I316_00700 [Kwoniella heveanensis BCC8398]